MQVQIGDKVVFPGCGVGTVKGREKLEVDGECVETLRIGIRRTDATVWVPVDALVAQGVRPVMDEAQVPRTWDILTSQEAPKRRGPWPQRRRRYTEMLMECSPYSLACLVGELAAVRRNKKDKNKKDGLSFTEKRYFEQARNMLIGEIAAARDIDPKVVEARFDKLTAVAA